MELLTWMPLLGLALALPLFFWIYRRSLVDRPPAMKLAAAVCRMLALLFLLLALCRPFFTRKSDDVHVAFLLDGSESVDPGEMRRGIAEIKKSVEGLKSGDTWSLFLFARELRRSDFEQAEKFIAECEAGRGDAAFRSATDLDGALAGARFDLPANRGRRLVVLSDGLLETPVGAAAERLAAENTDLRFVKLGSLDKPEAAVTSIEAGTPLAFEGEMVRFTVKVSSNRDMNAKLRLIHRGVAVAEQAITLKAKEETACHTEVRMVTSGDTVWEAELVPDDDWFPANNQLSMTLPVRGKPRILVIHEKPAQMRPFERLMREQDVTLETRGARGLPDSFEEILAFDAIMLADVPATAISPKQMAALKRYVTDFGGGLIMTGSENTFGIGGYFKTPVEEVLPLVSRFEKDKEKPSLAMVLVLDKSGSMSGQPLELARQAAKSAAELLGNQDQIAVIAFDDQPQLILDLTSAANRAQIAAAIDSIAEGGGTDMQPGMVQARDILRGANAKLKHVIGMTDGQTAASNLVELSREMADSGMTVSTVAMGGSAASELLAAMADAGRGRFYQADAIENVPQIFTRETMQASRSAIKEDLYEPAGVTEHPIMAGFENAAFPPVLGYVMARPKPTAQVLLAVESGDPLLAVGKFGLGTGVAFTGDLTERWGSEWLAWQGCGKFWAQVFRGTLRKEESVGIEARSERERGRWDIDVRATDDAGRPLAAVPWTGNALDDSGKEFPVKIEESGIGRYRVRVDPGDAPRLTLRLHDPERGKVKTLRWERGYPAEYRLSGEPDPALAKVAVFDAASPRAGIPVVRVRSSALPWAGLVAIVFMIAGIVLRRV
jgi:uncharacterized membrane protein